MRGVYETDEHLENIAREAEERRQRKQDARATLWGVIGATVLVVLVLAALR